ncbi:MAG: NADH-quinone oxidoreductase subunit NuoK [Planctomycetota bacterium]
MNLGIEHFLILTALIFCLGLYNVMTRRNAIGVLMGVELILNAAAINFVAFSHYGGNRVAGQIYTLFIIVLAAAEAAVALAIVVAIYKRFHNIDVEKATLLKG